MPMKEEPEENYKFYHQAPGIYSLISLCACNWCDCIKNIVVHFPDSTTVFLWMF